MQFTLKHRQRRTPWERRRRLWHRHFALLPVQLDAKPRPRPTIHVTEESRAKKKPAPRVFAWLTTIERRWSNTHRCWLYRALDTHSQGE